MGNYFYRNGQRLKLKKQHRLPGYDYSSPGWYFITICTKNKEFFLGDIKEKQMVLSKVGEIAQSFWLEIPQRFSNVLLDAWIIMPNHLHGILRILDEDMDSNDNWIVKRTVVNKVGRETCNEVSENRSINTSGNAPWRVPTISPAYPFFHTNPNSEITNTLSDIIIRTTGETLNDRNDVSTGIHPLKRNSISSIINHFKGNVKRYCNKNGMEYFEWQSRFHDRIIRNEKALWMIRRYIRENPERWERDRFIPKAD